MDKYWGKAKDGRYICPVCNEKFDEDLLSTGKCPNCGFHEQGGLKPKIKGAKYDEGKPRPSLVPVEAIEANHAGAGVWQGKIRRRGGLAQGTA